MQRKLAQHFFPFGGELQVNFAAILRPTLPVDKSGGLQAVHKLNRAVMLDLQALGKLGNLGTHVRRQPLQREKELMLARLKTCFACCPLAKPQEPANVVPELGQ